jgi:two-component system nitrate/nitrite response regulator NarL
VHHLVRLVVAVHQQVFAEGLAVMLDAEDDLTVLGVAHDASAAVALTGTHQPTVVLLDAHLPGDDLDATLMAVKAAAPVAKVLLLSDDASSQTIAAVAATGADGLVAKNSASRQVMQAIRAAVDGRRPMVVAASGRQPGRDWSVGLRVQTLTGREQELLGLLAKGWPSRRIAEDWQVSLATVRTHVQNLLIKLGVHSKLEAAAFALQHGLVAPTRAATRDRTSA